MKTFKNILTASSATVAAFFTNVIIYAAEADILKEQDRTMVNSSTFLRASVVLIVNYFLSFLGFITVLIIIYNGALVVVGSDEGRLEKAGKNIGYSLIGIVIIFLAFAIVNWVIPAVLGPGTQ